jgi:restriction system protein
VEWRLAWSRTYLKGAGLVTNSSRGVWALTPNGLETIEVDPGAVISSYPRQPRETSEFIDTDDGMLDEFPEEDSNWREQLISILRLMDPSGFERLCQRLMRESGFIQVEVTGRTGDGGIDGRGIIRLAGLIGMPVLFQCKRYSDNSTVNPSQIRDFRGAMTGRTDRGLIITTGRFTRDAQNEATRDGALPIDLIDGDLLVEKLKELQLGVNVTTRQIEVVEVNADWFASF